MSDDALPNNSENFLTAKQLNAIPFLLSCKTLGEAAKSAKVTERTLYEWLKKPEFRAALREAEKQSVDIATRRLMAGQGAALEALEKLMTNAKHESTKRQAAVDWLNMLLRYRDLNELDERIEKLERKVFDEQTGKNQSARSEGEGTRRAP